VSDLYPDQVLKVNLAIAHFVVEFCRGERSKGAVTPPMRADLDSVDGKLLNLDLTQMARRSEKLRWNIEDAWQVETLQDGHDMFAKVVSGVIECQHDSMGSSHTLLA